MTQRVFATICLFALACGPPLLAGGTPTPPPNQLLVQLGSGSGLGNGDYVSSAAAPGLDSYYSYFIEVPPGTAQLVAEIFDADLGAGGGAAAHDLDLGVVGLNTSVAYSLIDPTGAVISGPIVLAPGVCGFCNNAWAQFPTVVAPLNGHWEIRVDMSSAVTAGADLNGLGLRAHDGVAGAGGTELNVYAESYLGLGTLGNPSTRTTQLYPYVTSGCEFDANDFDGDAPQAGSLLTFNSRTGAFTQAVGISGPTVWQNSTISGWTNDGAAVDYGLWDAPMTVTAVAGGLGANVVDFWLGDFQAANPPTGGLGPPPTAQPEPGSLRIYFPRDGGGSPAKPYLEQLVTHVAGPNPPTAGLVSRVRITLRVVNPAPNAITFAAPARVVNAQVPGGGAVYAGGPVLGQGALIAQPAIGGVGAVTWDPGIVAAGTTALFGYLVDVTPPLPGSRVPVTGTPGVLGTTGTFLDGTARLPQTRATYTTGPLCELAVTADLPTHATLSQVRGFAEGRLAGLEWSTTSEVGTVGFEVYRHDAERGGWVPVGSPHGELLPGRLTAPAGGHYRLADPEVRAGGQALYSIVEIDQSGRRRVHGPFEVELRSRPNSSEIEPRLAMDGASGFRSSSRSGFEPAGDPAKIASEPRGSLGPTRRVKIEVAERGVYRISTADLAEALLWPEASVLSALDRRSFSLTSKGREVSWSADSAGFLFFATEIESLFATENVYWLEAGVGLPWQPRVAVSGGATSAGSTFRSQADFEHDVFAATAFGPDPASDYWFWKTVLTGHPTFGVQNFDVDLPGVDDGESLHLEIRLQSATTEGLAGEHQAEVRFNDRFVGRVSWSGIAGHRASFEVPAGAARERGNVLEIEGVRPDGSASIGFFIDGFDIEYPRRFRLDGGELELGGVEGDVTIEGLGSEMALILDITDLDRPVQVNDGQTVLTLNGPALIFAADGDSRYRVTTELALKAPTRIHPGAAPALTAFEPAADYVVISADSLLDPARRLIERPQVGGLTAKIVSIESVYDQFGDGLPGPPAIEAFLDAARDLWNQNPRSVTLVGSGSYDYRDLLGFGTHLVPPLMVSTEGGLIASDQPYSDVDSDGHPDLAVGRIPARNAAELEAYLSKLEAYEAAVSVVGGEDRWQHRWLLVADQEDGAEFAAETERLSRRLPTGLELERIYLDELSPEAGRIALSEAWQQGAGVVHYFGHGGLDRFSDSGLLTVESAAALDQSPRLPVLVAATCAVNRFGLPNFQALGETLVLDDDGGAVAVFSAAGLSQHGQARHLSRALTGDLADSSQVDASPAFGPMMDAPSLGGSILRSSRQYLDAGGDPGLLRLYSLLGDPETALAPRPLPPAAGSPSGES